MFGQGEVLDEVTKHLLSVDWSNSQPWHIAGYIAEQSPTLFISLLS